MSTEIQIVEYQDTYKEDFKKINVEWISTFFKIEAHDLEQLDQPEEIINAGGQIFLALIDGQVVGTSALIHDGDGVYELAKMGVTPTAQGLGLGKLLCQRTITEALKREAKMLYLLSNKSLKPAITMYEKLGFVEAPLGDTLYERTDIKMVYQGAE
jgi:putative acetyltransferase